MLENQHILYYLPKGKINKKGETPIYCRITINGERITFSLNSSNPNEVKELINSTQSLEELIDIYNSYPDIRDTLKQDFVNKKLSFIPPKNN